MAFCTTGPLSQFFVKSLSLYPPQTGGFKRKMLILPTKNSDIYNQPNWG
jgi:hypothetical protein